MRVVGTCAPLEASWPEWAKTRPGIVTTELGAYRARSRIVVAGELTADIKAWLAGLFAAFGGIDGGHRAFYSEACSRLFDGLLFEHAFVPGLAEGLGGCAVTCAEDWVGQPRLHAMLAPTGSCVGPGARRPPRSGFAARLGARAALYTAGAMVEVVRDYIRSSPSRAVLRAQRSQPVPDPPLWVTLLATTWRSNRHVIQSVVLPEVARGGAVGSLFFGELARGQRNEQNLRVLEGNDLWTGLGPARTAILQAPMEQTIGPDSLWALGKTLLIGACRAAQTTTRLARSGSGGLVRIGGYGVDLGGKIEHAAKLVSVSVVRATAAELATRQIVERHAMQGAFVVLATSGMVETAMPDIVLQSVGATTLDFVHGTRGDGLPGSMEGCSMYKIVWTQADADAEGVGGVRCIVGGMPVPALAPRGRPRAGKRVLLMSSYLHRDRRVDGRYPQVAAQHELLRIVDAFAREPERGVTFRWRPHPADHPEEVLRVRAAHAPMELSDARKTPLAEDLAWCDAVVSILSSAVFESLFADVPVFLQAHPDQWGTPVTSYLDPGRVFYWGADGAAQLSACLARLDVGDESALAPERAARLFLFGPTGEPKSVRTLIDQLRGGVR